MTRHSAFFINGGAGRVVCSIPALEKFHEENPDNDFVIICEGGTDFFKGHPVLHAKAYDFWHKNLFEDKLKDRNLYSPEPYRVWEYYNQECSLSQAYDLEINNKGVRELPKPKIYLSKQEQIVAKQVLSEIKEKTNKEKIIVFQPFGRGVFQENGIITDFSGRSFEPENTINIVKKLSKKYGVAFMSEIGIEFQKHDVKEPVAMPQAIDLRSWAAIIKAADGFLGCDSVGQHIAYSFDVPSTVVVGSTFRSNVSYPDSDSFKVLDMGEGVRQYSPIRITVDEYTDRINEGIMIMNEAVEDVIIETLESVVDKFETNKKTRNQTKNGK